MAAAPPSAGGKDRLLRLIALFKFFKATLLILVGLGALKLLNPEVAQRARHWVVALAMSYDRPLTRRLLAVVTRLSPEHLQALGIGAFLYAALFTTEGVGLWLGRRWAEYLTIIATGSFVPFEILEVARRPTAPRLAALVLNLLVVGYLIYHLRKRRS